ncbi:hypothetical protein C8Q79DRAFT_317582 [Trametes meyenii]|nr:hypothetical protein C8Q79DRAFT_317582 [Trametes meyenii]
MLLCLKLNCSLTLARRPTGFLTWAVLPLPNYQLRGFGPCARISPKLQDHHAPHFLIVQISIEPSLQSLLSLPGASFILGPKLSVDCGAITYNNAELFVDTPLLTTDNAMHAPLYLHTVPQLRINMPSPSLYALKDVFWTLEGKSLERLTDAAHDNLYLAYERHDHGRRLHSRRFSGLDTTRIAEPEEDPTYIFGELHNPDHISSISCDMASSRSLKNHPPYTKRFYSTKRYALIIDGKELAPRSTGLDMCASRDHPIQLMMSYHQEARPASSHD